MKKSIFILSLLPILHISLTLFFNIYSIKNIRSKIFNKMKLEITDSIFDDATCDCQTILNKINYIIRNGIGNSNNLLDLKILNYNSKDEIPTSENRNTIAIISDVTYSGYYSISENQPKKSKQGDIWIITNSNSSTYLFSNYAKIPISHIMQYKNGTWILVESYLYDGMWKSLAGKITVTLTAENGTIDGGKTLKNLVTNGSFENGTKGWYATRSKDGVNSPNTLRTEDTSIFSSLYKSHGIRSYHNLDTVKNANYYAFQEFNIPIGNKLYIRAMKKGTGTNDFVIMTYNGESEDQEIKAKYVRSEKNGLSLHSGYGNTKYLTKQFLQLGSCVACFGDYYIDEVMVIDVTSSYGKGGEASQNFLDSILYFDDVASVNQKEIIPGEEISFSVQANEANEFISEVVCENGSDAMFKDGKVIISNVYQNERCKITAKSKELIDGTSSTILSGYKAYDAYGNLIEGTMASDASTATASHILSGYKGYQSNGNLITGSLPSFTSVVKSSDVILDDKNSQLKIYLNPGAYLNSNANHSNRAAITVDYSTMSSLLSITSSKIKKGTTVSGITGNYTPKVGSTSVHVTERGSNYCGTDWYLTSDIEAGTYLVVNVMYFSPGIVSGSDMSLYKSSSAGADSVTKLSESKSSYASVQVYRATINTKRSSGTAMGRMSNCASGNDGSIYGKSIWTKIS